MRVAFVGKGGAGKSAIAGTFCRALARNGEPVLAIDSDPLPGLAFSLGLKVDDVAIPDEAIEEKPEGEEGPRFRLVAGIDALQAVDRFAAIAPDGVRFLQFGKVKGNPNVLFRSQFAFRQIVREMTTQPWHLVGDLPGGTRQAFTGWGNFAETIFVVVEPTAKSLLSGRRLARMAALNEESPQRVLAIASKVRQPGDAEMVADRTGLEVVAVVPWDEELAEAERQTLAPIDAAPECPAVRAVESLVEFVSKERVA